MEKEKKGGQGHGADAVIKPTLREELERFKDLVKQITSHEIEHEKKKWFRMEKRQFLRRVADFGIEGRQPGISAYVKMSKQEEEDVPKSLISQKVGANSKSTKACPEHWQRINDSNADM